MDSKLYNDIGKAVEIAKKNGGTLTEQNLLYVVKVATDIANKTGADFDSLQQQWLSGDICSTPSTDKETWYISLPIT